MSAQEIITAARRCEQVWWEHICKTEPLEYGVAFTAVELPQFAEAQQLRDVWLHEVDGATAFERAEQYFSKRELTCHLWSPASGQEIEPVARVMDEKGWQKASLVALGMADTSAVPDPEDVDGIRVLPARAMRRTYRQLLDEIGNKDGSAEAAFERLDDANCDVLLAVRDKVAVGRMTYHEVGDFARLRDFFVAQSEDFDALGKHLIAHALLIARRLLPRVLVTCVAEEDARQRALFESCGFAAAGEMVRFRRPA